MDDKRKQARYDDFCEEIPPYSRLFVVIERRITEQMLRDAFSKYGTIEDIRLPRDRTTGELKGIAYIKFSKTSEAAYAMEEMNLKCLKNLPKSSRPLKIMVATSRSDIQSDTQESNKYRRLFIYIPKTMNEDDVHESFRKYGIVDAITIQRDHHTGDSKGFAYVLYQRFSEAALAYEMCDKKYRAIFALPKGHSKRHETTFETNINNLAVSSTTRSTLMSMLKPVPRNGYTRINFMCHPILNTMQVQKLFDIIPGMIDCHYVVDLVRNHGKGTISYSNAVSASYAVEKLNLFEYPPGSKIFVRPDNSPFQQHEQCFSNIPNAVKKLRNAIDGTSNSASPDLAQLAEAIAEASKLIKIATGSFTDDAIPDSSDLNYCSVKLPPTQPLADIDSQVAKRCFLVCKPQPPPLTVLRDIFCRFGDLINVYTLPNKTVGYARYASAKAAEEAIKTLHGAEICGVRIKVIEADEEAPAKRMRFND